MKIFLLKGYEVYIGLMFKKIDKDSAYILDLGKEKISDIHTFFCLQSFDIFLMNSKFEIIEKYYNVKPFRIIIPKKPFRYIIEGINLDEKINKVIKYLKNI